MPTFSYQCAECTNGFETFSKSFRKENIGDMVTDQVCPQCQSNNVRRVWPDELDNQIVIGAFKARCDKQAEDNTKRAKDPDRAMKSRKSLLGSDSVNGRKSELAKRDHKIVKKIVPKDQGVSNDIDKTEFIKLAAKNPNAVKAAEEVLKRGGKS